MRYFIVILLTTSLSSICSSYFAFRVTLNCVPPHLFKCRTGGQCIQASWLCDGDNDCVDASDEDQSKCNNKTCSSLQMRCKDNGRCIPETWKCDGENDCSDGSDEDPQICGGSKEIDCKAIGRFQCLPGVCIPMAWKCDGAPDCASGIDEVNCTNECLLSNEFSCGDGSCIDKTWVCDGDDDCIDHSDEKDCPLCREGGFQCKDKACIPQRWRCDGDFDCLDQSDEENCTYTGISTSRPRVPCTEFLCPDRITCINHDWVCDGKPDCPEGTEETPTYCKNVTCRLDEFKCHNNKCLPGKAQCNGYEDCADGSDEQNCEATKPPCKEDEFDCGDSFCIPQTKVCDGTPHCPKREDEPVGKCGVNECQQNNGGCSQSCVDTPTGFFCKCREGFKLIDNSTCDDIDECEDPASCSQICINEKGTFKCECHEGYLKEIFDHRRCKAKNSNTTLIVTRRHDIREISVHHKISRLLINETKSAIALDIHIGLGLIFYSDAIENKIFKANTKHLDVLPVPIIQEESILCDGLAVDWIYDHIYWADSVKDSISVANFDGKMRKTIIINDLDKPRAIALNPVDGWMFWSDWGITPRIERAGMDGTHRSTIVSRDLEWPNGITLDFVKERLYWVDARLDMISSVNYDGSLRRTVLRSSAIVVHPFSIAVFEDNVYWTDWARHGVFQADKFNGSNAKLVLGSLSSLMVVHVNHPLKQPNGTNYCSKIKCSHICLPAPRINKDSSKAACACPDGLYLTENGLHCSTQLPSSTNSPEVSEETTLLIPSTKMTAVTPTTLGSGPTKTPNNSSENSGSNTQKIPVPSPKKEPDDSSENMPLNSEGENKSSKKHIILGLFILLAICIVASIVLYYGYNRYYKISRRNVSVFQPNYRKMGDEEVSLTKDDFNDSQHEESSSDQRSRNANYDNFL